jgi:CheY-like chemotaxis protein
MERIVFNLISNAIRYTQRGGIVVGCRRCNDGLRIEVWDSGSGIPADQQEKIFGEFYRLGEPDRDRGAGLGLGLAIVDRLCRLLEYSREVKSVLGKGSVFAVTVPTAAAVAAPQLEPPGRDRRHVSKGKLILVIDDDPFSLEGMDGILRSWGCQVITADTDSKALKALTKENHPPDLIISDYHLSSGRTGPEIIERLRAALAVQIPAFLISGDINTGPAREAEAKGFHILHKPVSPMALRAMLHQALKRGQNGGEQPVAH